MEAALLTLPGDHLCRQVAQEGSCGVQRKEGNDPISTLKACPRGTDRTHREEPRPGSCRTAKGKSKQRRGREMKNVDLILTTFDWVPEKPRYPCALGARKSGFALSGQ